MSTLPTELVDNIMSFALAGDFDMGIKDGRIKIIADYLVKVFCLISAEIPALYAPLQRLLSEHQRVARAMGEGPTQYSATLKGVEKNAL